MFVDFFYTLRSAGVPVSVKEFLALLSGLERRVIGPDSEQFYYLARTALVKDERHFDAFDRAFAHFFEGARELGALPVADIPEEWLRGELGRHLSEEEMQQLQAAESLEALLRTFAERLGEQDSAHHGGNRWVGTGGTSPYGSGGYNPAGVRVGEQGRRQSRAAKVWEQRRYRSLSGEVSLNTRNIKMALKRLRRFTREGAPEELDVDGTIRNTVRDGVMYDVAMRPARRNRVKVLLFFDIGGSMDAHVRRCEQLFASARAEFRHLETYYFHNCIYEHVWKDEHRWEGRHPTFDLLHTYNRDWRVIVVGDAAMSPYELLQAGGSIDHFNPEPGLTWLQRLRQAFPHSVWLNPEPEHEWPHVESIRLVRQAFEGHMYPLTLDGLGEAMDTLRRQAVPPALLLND